MKYVQYTSCAEKHIGNLTILYARRNGGGTSRECFKFGSLTFEFFNKYIILLLCHYII